MIWSRFAPVCIGLLLAGPVPSGRAGAEDRVDFARDIRPILARNCYECHGPRKQQSGLRLDRKADALAGGDSGPAIARGKAGESELIARVTDDDPATAMPPKGRRLSPRQVERLRAWVDQGAPWPDGVDAQPVAGDHWAFRPPVRPTPPAIRRGDWVRNPIDHFVLARLEGLGVSPSSEADRPTLIRRLSLDLLGLPPTPAEVEDIRRRPGARRLRAAGRSPAVLAPLRRALGAALARPGPLRRQRRLREGPPRPDAWRYPRLGHRRDQPRPAVRPVHRSSNWPATCSPASDRSRGSPPASTATR